MAKEEKLFSVKCTLTDKDFDDVYRIYAESERKNHNTPLIVCIVIALLFCILAFLLKNVAMIFYAFATVIIGISYRFIPLNKKFLATNRLQYGEIREMTFYPHEVTMFEWLDDDEELTDEEREDATAHFNTKSLKAYENKNGILLAELNITNNFLYIPKRDLDDETLAMLIDFAKNACDLGYDLLEMTSLLGDEGEQEMWDLNDDSASDVSAENVCDQYYGASKLRIYDENGERVRDFDGDEKDAAESADGEESVDSEAVNNTPAEKESFVEDFSEVSDAFGSDETVEDFTEIETEEANADES